MRMLDNVIDLNFYPIPEARAANLRHRPVGLGLMGFQDALTMLGLSYASEEAVQFADRSSEAVAYYAILASSELAKERGPYESYTGSKWDRGLLPIDTIDLLAEERGETIDVPRTGMLDWSKVRQAVREYRMRNSNTLAIAPTATIANILGVSQSIEPAYANLFVKSNLSGEFTVVNELLVRDLDARGMWDQQMLDDLKYFDGSVQDIERVPDDLKAKYATAFEIDPSWLIECAARRQKWIDMGQSLNLYVAEPSGRKLSEMYLLAWRKGLKTTYYLRSRGATQSEKSTLDINARGLQPRWMRARSASADVTVDREPDSRTPVCSLEEGCEACQ
jgi:ribonucleoside-diphosphate reductase alpha chain